MHLNFNGSNGPFKMADHVWTVLCKDFVIDSESRNVTIFQTLEQLMLIRGTQVADQLPENIQLNFALVSLWTRSDRNKPESTKMRFVFKGPDGKKIGANENVINLTEHVRHRVLTRLTSIAFKGFGRYTFVVQKLSDSGRWLKVASIPLEVLLGESKDLARIMHE